MSSSIRSLKAPNWLTEFRAFIMRGSVVDLAVGIIIGAAFTGVVNSLVKDVFNPMLGLALGGVDFSNLFVPLNGQHYDSLADAQHAGAADAEPRPVHQRDHQLPHRRLRDLLGGEGADPAAPARGRQDRARRPRNCWWRSATS